MSFRSHSRFAALPRREVLGVLVPVAVTRRSRLAGLALLPRERAGGGLLIPGCRSVHTFGMRFPLLAVFLGPGETVIAARHAPPRRLLAERRAVAVLEVPAPAGGAEPPAGLEGIEHVA